MVVPLLRFRYRSIKVWKWGLLQRGAEGAVPSDLLFSPGMACSVTSDPGEPVGFQKCVAWTTFFLILIFRSWCRHLWVGMLPFEQSWSFSVLLSLLYLVHRKRGGSLLLNIIIIPLQQIKREKVLSFHALDEVGGFPSTFLHPCWGSRACFIFQAENKVWPCPCGSCDKHILSTSYVPGFTLLCVFM